MLRSCLTGLSPAWPAVMGIACRTPSRSGRRWQAVAGRRRRRWAARRWRGGVCDPSATSSAVLLRSWVVPQLQFIDRVDGVRDGVLLVLPSVVHRDRYPQCFSWCRCLGNAVALWRLVKEFHIFSTCCSRSSPGIWTLFLEPLVLAATCPCALRQSTAALGRISSFLREKWTRISSQFTLGNLNIISTSCIW